MSKENPENDHEMQELTEAELATVSGGGRRWCWRNGRWYVCGSGKRPN